MSIRTIRHQRREQRRGKKSVGQNTCNFSHPGEAQPNKHPDITACITYFIRPNSLALCLSSLHQYHLGMEALIQDTTVIQEGKIDGNLSQARNRLYKRVETPYILVLEEDMELIESLPLKDCLDILKEDKSIQGVGGVCLEEDRGAVLWKHDFSPSTDGLGIHSSQRNCRETSTGVQYQPCELVMNFGVFRTQFFRDYKWDENLPITEHREFFFRVSREGCQFAFIPHLRCKHHKDRSNNLYRQLRSRQLFDYQTEKHKVDFGRLYRRDEQGPKSEKPNIILIGVGHSNTTLTVRQLIQLGWQPNLDWLDEGYQEPVDIRLINQDYLETREFKNIPLNRLNQPWVLKDPRWTRVPRGADKSCLDMWLPSLTPYKPVLLWVTKDKVTVAASYETRGEGTNGMAQNYQWCEAQYQRWVGPKLRLQAEDIARASMLFDVNKFRDPSNRNTPSPVGD